MTIETERATDPRLDTPVVEIPVVDPIASVAEAPVEGAEGDESVVEPVVEVKPRKTAEEVLKGRVGHLTKTLSTKDEILNAKEREIEEFRSRLAAANALIEAKSPPSSVETPVVTQQPATYSQADFEAAVTARTEAQEFNRKADDMYNVGATKFPDWKDTVDTLVVSGLMNKDLLDAAMAIEDGPAVLHYLGTNLDEAERVNALSPIRKAAEMAKLSATLTAPKILPVSSAPAPIRPVAGSPSPQVDLQRISDSDDMRSYIAARAKQGSRWAQARGQRA